MSKQAPSTVGHPNQTSDGQLAITLPPRPMWVGLAFAFTLLYLALHLYWALGGSWGLPLLAMHDPGAVQAVNWVVCAVMLIGALFVLALHRPVGRRVPAWMVLLPIWLGAVVCVSHAIFGFVTKALYLGGVHGAVKFPVVPGVSAATAAAQNHLSAVQDLAVFEPSFLLQGGLIAMAAWHFIRTPAGRRRWSTSVMVGIIVIDAFGALLSLTGKHFAIS